MIVRTDSPLRAYVLLAAICLGAYALVSAQARDWKSASPDYVIRLPTDHASHPAYKIEWWYYTGNVETDRGRRFGYQVTFFRIGVDKAPKNPSKFAIRDLYITHIALTDVAGRRYLSAERVNRAGVAWAGASMADYHVWNEDWEARLEFGRHRLQGRDPRFALDLTLFEDRPPVLNGVKGYSQKGASPGNATEYYSLTRMPTEGTITLEGERYSIRGHSWMDHEFGTSFLERDQRGWDWFSLQLEDGTDAMLFELRRSDGTVDAHSSGTFSPATGAPTRLARTDFTLTPGRLWKSSASQGAYPVEWKVQLPGQGLDLTITPVVDDQELVGGRTGVSYWEGAIDVQGTRRGEPIRGRGYLEMTGYAGPALGEMLR
jgi:predicted secreted hydrolase